MRSQAAVIGSQWTPTSHIVNAFRVSYSRLAVTRGVADGLPSPVSVGVNMYNLVEGKTGW
jgi:hypothetical protein